MGVCISVLGAGFKLSPIGQVTGREKTLRRYRLDGDHLKRQMPWILKGHVTWVRDQLLRKYSIDQLNNDDVWYFEVIEAPEIHFRGISETDIAKMYDYFSPSALELHEIQQKYGNQNDFTVVLANLIDLYQKAFQNAMNKLKVV